jgi:hypothetical protein
MKIQISIIALLLLFAALAPTLVFAGTSGPSPIPPPPTFQVSTNVLTLCKGMINSVPIQIKSTPGAAVMEDVQLSLQNSRYVYTVGNGTTSSVNVTANVTRTVPLMVFASLNSTPLISAGLAINYQYSTLYSDSEVRNISFGVQTCPSTLQITATPGVLTSGKIQNVTLNFTNNGNVALNYISIHASLPSIDGTFLGAQPIQISTIAPKKSVNIQQSVFVYNNATQSFPINMSVSLYNGTQLEQLSVNPIVLSSGIINISSSSTTLSPATPAAGSIFSISFVLTDTGTAKASAVTATALSSNGLYSYGSNSVFVGDMQVDSQTPVTLTLTSRSTVKSGNYIVPVRVNYLNNLRQNLSTTMYIPVPITGATAFNSLASVRSQYAGAKGGGVVILLILIIAVIVFLVLYLRERGLHKKHVKEFNSHKQKSSQK